MMIELVSEARGENPWIHSLLRGVGAGFTGRPGGAIGMEIDWSRAAVA